MEVTKEEIQQMIEDAINARENANRFQVAKTPYHEHNGVDSPPINASNGRIGDFIIDNNTLTGIYNGTPLLQLAGNDITLYDDSSSNGSVISGNTATLNFTRSDDSTQSFILQKRVAYNADLDNVLELYATAPSSGKYNHIFIGRDGTGDTYRNVGIIVFSANTKTANTRSVYNGTFAIDVSTNNTVSATQSFSLLITDARNVYGSDAVSGICGVLVGRGTNGFAGIGWDTGTVTAIGLYQLGATQVSLGLTLMPDADISYDIGDGTHRIRNIFTQQINSATPLSGTKTYYVADSSGGAVNRKLTFVNGILTAET